MHFRETINAKIAFDCKTRPRQTQLMPTAAAARAREEAVCAPEKQICHKITILAVKTTIMRHEHACETLNIFAIGENIWVKNKD